MHLVEPDIIVFHIGLWHHTLVDLVLPEGKDWDTIPKPSIYIHKIIRPEFLPAVLLLCSVGEPLLDKKSSPLGEVLGVLVAE